MSNTIAKENWQESMYDDDLANQTINSKQFLDLAVKEANFLIGHLGLSPPTKLLDVPCGTGRHALHFAKAGITVTALDINEGLLKAAKDNCGNLPIDFAKADMRDLSLYHHRFDVIVNLFSSFGYLDTDEANESSLDEMIACLRPGGKLVIHLIERTWLMKVFQPVSWSETEPQFCMDGRSYDPETQYIESNSIHLNKSSGLAKRYYHKMRLYSSDEIVSLFEANGLGEIQIIGNFDGATFEKGVSTHPIYVATKR